MMQTIAVIPTNEIGGNHHGARRVMLTPYLRRSHPIDDSSSVFFRTFFAVARTVASNQCPVPHPHVGPVGAAGATLSGSYARFGANHLSIVARSSPFRFA